MQRQQCFKPDYITQAGMLSTRWSATLSRISFLRCPTSGILPNTDNFTKFLSFLRRPITQCLTSRSLRSSDKWCQLVLAPISVYNPSGIGNAWSATILIVWRTRMRSVMVNSPWRGVYPGNRRPIPALRPSWYKVLCISRNPPCVPAYFRLHLTS